MTINIKPSHKGRLHAKLGIKPGQKIPLSSLLRAKASAGPAERKEITFAQNARHWSH